MYVRVHTRKTHRYYMFIRNQEKPRERVLYGVLTFLEGNEELETLKVDSGFKRLIKIIN